MWCEQFRASISKRCCEANQNLAKRGIEWMKSGLPLFAIPQVNVDRATVCTKCKLSQHREFVYKQFRKELVGYLTQLDNSVNWGIHRREKKLAADRNYWRRSHPTNPETAKHGQKQY